MSLRPLSKELQKLAESELNEQTDRIYEDVSYIKEWIKKQPHLNARIDDRLIVSFLRGCKFSLEKSKQKIECYYTYRTLMPEFFDNRDPLLPEIQEVLKQGCYWLPLPKSNRKDAPRVLYLALDLMNPDTVHILNVMKVNFMIFDILLNEDDNFVIAGHKTFNNLKGLSVGQIMQVTPSIIKKIIGCMHDAYPLRPKGAHLMNMPNALETIIRPLLLSKTKDRIKFSSDLDYNDLHSIIPKTVLPRELGGEYSNINDLIDEWKKKIESYRDWFLNDVQFRSNELKRIGKPKNVNDLFGIEGSFRKLEVD